MKNIVVAALACAALVACQGEKKPSRRPPRRSKAKLLEQANKKMKLVASLADKVTDLSTKDDMKSGILKGQRNSYSNFDVLKVDELSDVPEWSDVRTLLKHPLGECAKGIADNSGDSYTLGKVDADAFVFDLEDDGALVGSARIVATTPEAVTLEASTAENDLREKLGSAAFDALADALHVKT